MCKKHLLGMLLLWAMTLGLVGCLPAAEVNEDGTHVDIVPGALDPGSYVCNPMDDHVDNQVREQGVHGRLFYVEPGGPQYSRVADYIEFGTEPDVDLYFNRLFVPTRPFDRGFVTESGETITAADGFSTLYEWFGIHFESRLTLSGSMSPGRYQMAILSDDGAVMNVGPSGEQNLVIDNDGETSTRLRCATEAVELQAGQMLPFSIDYYQGPRYHIAMILLWRPWPASPADVNDPLCDKWGNDFWFDSTQVPPQPQSNYNDLLSRGWQVVPAESLMLPERKTFNPCNEPAPVISGVSVPSVSTNAATVTWQTDRPATTQVSLTEVATGVVTLTALDSTLNENHSVMLTGLRSNTQYRVKVISSSASGRSTESTEIIFRTSR